MLRLRRLPLSARQHARLTVLRLRFRHSAVLPPVALTLASHDARQPRLLDNDSLWPLHAYPTPPPCFPRWKQGPSWPPSTPLPMHPLRPRPVFSTTRRFLPAHHDAADPCPAYPAATSSRLYPLHPATSFPLMHPLRDPGNPSPPPPPQLHTSHAEPCPCCDAARLLPALLLLAACAHPHHPPNPPSIDLPPSNQQLGRRHRRQPLNKKRINKQKN